MSPPADRTRLAYLMLIACTVLTGAVLIVAGLCLSNVVSGRQRRANA